MNCVVRSLAAVALLAASTTALAFTRETTSVGHPDAGLCLYWNTRTVPFYVNATTVSQGGAPQPCGNAAAAVDAVKAGFDTWNAVAAGSNACTDFNFSYAGTTAQTLVKDDGTNVVVFRTRVCDDLTEFTGCLASSTRAQCIANLNCWDRGNYGIGTIAITKTFFNGDTGQLTGADMELFAWDGVNPFGTNGAYGFHFTCGGPTITTTCTSPTQTDCNATDVQAVVGHEAGHVLGLDHVCSNNPADPAAFKACAGGSPIMAPTVGNVSQRALAADDISGVCTIYPKGAATVTCGSTQAPKSGGGGGCSTAGGTGVAGLLAAALAAARRRRS